MIKLIQYIILSFIIILLFPCNDLNAQHNKRKKVKPMMWEIGAGVAGGEGPTSSFYGPNVEYGFRKTVITMGSYINCSIDGYGSTLLAWEDVGYGNYQMTGAQNVQFNFNINAFAGAYPPGRKARMGIPVGAFLGVGAIATSMYSGDAGPMINFGLRGKTSKSFFLELKVFGAFTIINEMAYGGLNLKFPIGSGGNKKKFGAGYKRSGGG